MKSRSKLCVLAGAMSVLLTLSVAPANAADTADNVYADRHVTVVQQRDMRGQLSAGDVFAIEALWADDELLAGPVFAGEREAAVAVVGDRSGPHPAVLGLGAFGEWMPPLGAQRASAQSPLKHRTGH